LDLSIAIVSWNVRTLLRECLRSIFENTRGMSFDVFVCDNGSSDGSFEMVKAEFPQVKLIENHTNLGFTKANNLIIKGSTGRYVILLNPDTIVTKDSLATLVKFMDLRPSAGAVGPKLEYPDGSPQPSCRAFPTLETEIYRTLFLDQVFPSSPVFGKYLMSCWNHEDVREVDQPMGAALLVRRAAIEGVGSLDEGIFIWYDEVDWCKRIQDAGWKIYFTPEALIYHHKNKSFGQWKIKAALKGALVWRGSRNYYFRKHHGPLIMVLVNILDAAQIVLVFGLLYVLIRVAATLIRSVF